MSPRRVGAENHSFSNFKVYPNPADNTLHIEKGFIEKAELSIINIQGVEVINLEFMESKIQVDIEKLPSGVYYIQLMGDQANGVKRVVIK